MNPAIGISTSAELVQLGPQAVLRAGEARSRWQRNHMLGLPS
jgi:hypothetical protein